ncbi:hypothetical protein FOH10_24455 [Nocardia otitidiscaviarum]|uniref:Uncharacterized protein n=1 Tax=Nocardia otitidiscaviarum TaxID=1823 RepID=A0A516NR65_9NOCA|nr:hypothetical protein [Nocardia otitidiscaviarum]MCP9625315.1 hypothetical protein [Nocardia otitidiscaviarum]QDP81402.1 hypothetical protein FOH10_24455 [Nocardia otitidiscaviarum]
MEMEPFTVTLARTGQAAQQEETTVDELLIAYPGGPEIRISLQTLDGRPHFALGIDSTPDSEILHVFELLPAAANAFRIRTESRRRVTKPTH